MKKLVRVGWLGAVGLAVVIVLAACAQGSAAPLELTQKDSGSTQALAAGQELRITLDANPTTGYMWAVDGAVPPQLEQAGEPEYTAESNAIGAGGTEVWTFTGKTSGKGTLRLKYWRSFEPTATPAGTFEVTADVK